MGTIRKQRFPFTTPPISYPCPLWLGALYGRLRDCRLPLISYTDGFRTIINKALLEPWVLQGVLGSYSLSWIVDKYLAKKVEELFVKSSVGGDKVLEKS